jgi:hypothetical protein
MSINADMAYSAGIHLLGQNLHLLAASYIPAASARFFFFYTDHRGENRGSIHEQI